MAGFGPVGSFPVASILGSSASGTNYQLTAAYYRFEPGPAPSVTITITPPRVSWIGLEALHGGVPAARVTWIGAAVLRSVVSIATQAIITWMGLEATHSGQALARVTWMGVEVLRSVGTGGSSHRNCSIIW